MKLLSLKEEIRLAKRLPSRIETAELIYLFIFRSKLTKLVPRPRIRWNARISSDKTRLYSIRYGQTPCCRRVAFVVGSCSYFTQNLSSAFPFFVLYLFSCRCFSASLRFRGYLVVFLGAKTKQIWPEVGLSCDCCEKGGKTTAAANKRIATHDEQSSKKSRVTREAQVDDRVNDVNRLSLVLFIRLI